MATINSFSVYESVGFSTPNPKSCIKVDFSFLSDLQIEKLHIALIKAAISGEIEMDLSEEDLKLVKEIKGN